MAILPMIMGNGGAEYTETSLWTNQSPSSAFSGQDVSLSESIDNFKYIAVRYKSTTTSSEEGSQAARVIYLVEDVKKATSPSAALEPVSAFGNLNSNNSNYFYRYIVYKGSTTLFLSNSYSINASGNNTSLAIPLEILGLNELDHAGEDPLNPDEVKSVTKNSGNTTATVTFANTIQRLVLSHSNRYWIVKEGDYWYQYDSQSSNRNDRTSMMSVSGNTVTLSGTWSSSNNISFLLFAWF